ncbi:MAG: hypothetical protein WA990_05540, partial [Rubrobacteraceae bacterium]
MQSADKTPGSTSPETIGEILVSEGEITQDQLDHALELQGETSKDLGEMLLSLGYVEPADLASALARRLRLDYVVISELSEKEVDDQAIDMMEEQTLRKYKALPLRFEGNKLVVAMSDPNDLYALEDLRMISGRPVTPVVVTEEDLEGALDHLFGTEAYYEEEQPAATDDAPDIAPEPPLPEAEKSAETEEPGEPETHVAGVEETAGGGEPNVVAEDSASLPYEAGQEEVRDLEPDAVSAEGQPDPARRGRRALSGRGKMG